MRRHTGERNFKVGYDNYYISIYIFCRTNTVEIEIEFFLEITTFCVLGMNDTYEDN